MTKQEHKERMAARRRRQNERVGTNVFWGPMPNDPHVEHSHARENARRVRQMEARRG